MKIAVISSHTKSLFSFRMDMMKDFIKHGHSVIALGHESESEWTSKFEIHGIRYKQIFVDRNGLNPLDDLKMYKELKRFMKEEKPDKIFVYHAKTIIYASLAAKANGIKEVYPLVAGLGSIFRGHGIKNYVVKTILKIYYRLVFQASKKVFFQNNDDISVLVNYGLLPTEKVLLINGSGVNLDEFKPEPLPDKPAFLFIGRLLKDKGIMEYLKACKTVKQEYPEVRCMLVGPYDSNPSALQPEELEEYINQGIVEYYGEQQDVRPFLKQCSIFVLPSYHEGIPKAVLEAMAVSRAIITTDAPGCRETVIDGDNGYLVPIKDVNTLVEKMKYLINNKNVVEKMANRSLDIAKDKFDVKQVNKSIMEGMELL